MSAILKPAVYISWIPMGKVTVKPSTYISWVSMGKISVKPQAYASYLRVNSVVTTIADTKRVAGHGNVATADTRLATVSTNTATADTRRELVSPTIAVAEADTLRKVGVTNTIIADTSRCCNCSYNLVVADTSRITGGEYVIATVDTRREAHKTNVFIGDTRRLNAIIGKVTADTKRMVAWSAPVVGDSTRVVKKYELVPSDTSIRTPWVLRYVKLDGLAILQSFHDNGVVSFSMTLGELTLSDTYQLETTQPLNIDDMVQGQILDYPFSFLVEETSQRDLTQSVKGTYSKDKLLYTAIVIAVEEASVNYYAKKIAAGLGLKLNMRADTYTPSQDYEDVGMTYQDFISSLFGWTSKLPQMQTNVFIRGDTLNIIQRGQEDSVIDITDWPHSRPTIERRLVRSIWHSSSDEDSDGYAHNEEDREPIPFTGTIALGEISRTYERGFLVRETNEQGETIYTYANEYLIEKKTENKDGSSSHTTYDYATTHRDVYLFKETEQTKDTADDGGETSERVTYHAPLGYGWYATTVYVDGVLGGSSLSQGKPGGKASKFTIDQSNLSLGSRYHHYGERNLSPYASLIDTEFPVKEDSYLLKLTAAIEWLNRKTQETVTVEVISRVVNGVPEIDHIVDFTELILFNGNEYFLQSNAVTLSPRGMRQTIKMTRWY